ncbi:MAG: terpene cyclase/mutase family protein [Planctomycetes bacterium]|nr:terpene cyclase/mutase family protein [Planctomycetota bacterium]
MSRSLRPPARGALAAACLLSAAFAGPVEVAPPSPNSPDEPFAESLSLEKAAEFLDAASVTWTRVRKCGTCHTSYAYLFARPSLAAGPSEPVAEVRGFFEGRAANWETAKPRWDTEVVATAVALAVHDARTTGVLHPLTRKALDWAWRLQREDGAWEWLKCAWPPMEHDDYFGAVYVAIGVASAPEGYAETEAARAGLAKLRSYLRSHPAPDPHHRAMLLWASTLLGGLMTEEERAAAVRELLALQRPSGGWCTGSLGPWKRHDGSENDPEGPSDGYATGLAVYVLRQAGVPASDCRIQRGVAWLKAHQRASGRWFTRSPSTDSHHFLTHAGTAYAVMALAACGEAGPPRTAAAAGGQPAPR